MILLGLVNFSQLSAFTAQNAAGIKIPQQPEKVNRNKWIGKWYSFARTVGPALESSMRFSSTPAVVQSRFPN